MALQFNSYLVGVNGIPNTVVYGSMASGNQRIRIYPNSVSFPASAPADVEGLPGGYILEYGGFTVSDDPVPGTIVFNGAPGTTANASAASVPGKPFNESKRCTISCTCDFCALP